jgi:hypothetical protein
MHAKCFYLKDAIISCSGASEPFNIDKNIIIIVKDKPFKPYAPPPNGGPIAACHHF